MAISNSASGFRPGVCTSTTRPVSPFNGQVIYETDTKQTLVWQGSAWVMLTDADSPPGLQLVKTQTIGSGVSSVTVTGAFSSEFDNYLITINGGSGAGGDYGLNLRLGSTTSGYYNSGTYLGWGGFSNSELRSNGDAFSAAGIMTANNIRMFANLSSPFLASHTFYSASYVYNNASGGRINIAGALLDNNQYTSFTFYPGGGTMTGGTVRVYGYRNTI